MNNSRNGDGKKDAAEVAPPADLDAERQYLGACLLAGEVLDHDLHPADFLDVAHERLYAAMQDLRGQGKPIEVTLLADVLKRRGHWDSVGGKEYLTTIFSSVVVHSHAIYHADLVREKSRLRRLYRMAAEVMGNVSDGLPAEDVESIPEAFAELVRGERAKKSGGDDMATRIKKHSGLRQPVLHGLLREGETLNIVAATKTGKSWLTYSLVFSVITGRRFLGTYLPVPGPVLLIDNELHKETLDDRLILVAKKMGLDDADWVPHLTPLNLRGRLEDIHAIARRLSAVAPGTYKMIVLDALYRALPPNCDENSNSDMSAVYNVIDGIAERMKCAVVVIHHSSKGSQNAKSTTDVGAGAGAISRAVDSHFILRPHEEPNAVVVDGALRSWSPIEPFCLRWDFPLWIPADDLDPSLLRPDKPKRRREAEMDSPQEQPWTAERFAAEFVTAEPVVKLAIIDNACCAGMKETTAEKLLKRAAAKKLIHEWQSPDDRRVVLFATVPPPEIASKVRIARSTRKHGRKCRTA